MISNWEKLCVWALQSFWVQALRISLRSRWYLLDGAEVGISGHREVQIDSCGQQKVDRHVLTLLLGPEFHGAVDPRGHPAVSLPRPQLCWKGSKGKMSHPRSESLERTLWETGCQDLGQQEAHDRGTQSSSPDGPHPARGDRWLLLPQATRLAELPPITGGHSASSRQWPQSKTPTDPFQIFFSGTHIFGKPRHGH